METNPKCSLLVAKEPEDRGTLVVTLHGDAVAVRYLAYVHYLFLLFMCQSISLLVFNHQKCIDMCLVLVSYRISFIVDDVMA